MSVVTLMLNGMLKPVSGYEFSHSLPQSWKSTPTIMSAFTSRREIFTCPPAVSIAILWCAWAIGS